MKVSCASCGSEIERYECLVKRNKTGKWFCSVECRRQHETNRVAIKCERCGREFKVKAYRSGIARFCSAECLRAGKIHECHTCGKKFYRPPSHATSKRVFCSTACAAKTKFSAGFVPWNKGLKGLRMSPETEFKSGPRPDKRLPIGSISIRTRKRDGKPRAWIKVGDPNKWKLRAQIVWISVRGPIPFGMIVHHVDRNTLNDDVSNLELKTKAEHLEEHRAEFRKRRWQKRPQISSSGGRIEDIHA